MTYTVFVSHGWDDRWIAGQMARGIADAGGAPFIDVYDIKKGDRIEERIREGTGKRRELVVLLTRSSLKSRWVSVEIGSVWGQGKRIVGVLTAFRSTKSRRNLAAWPVCDRRTSLP